MKHTEAATRSVLCKKLFLEISQNSQENTCARGSFLIKLQAWPATLLKKSIWHRFFPVNFVKFLRAPFLQNTLGRLHLNIILHQRKKTLIQTPIYCMLVKMI